MSTEIDEIRNRLEKFKREPHGNTDRVVAIETFYTKAPDDIHTLLAALDTKDRIIKNECEDWAECHTFLQNAGLQMDPVDSYSGATALIDGIKEVVAQRDQARAALAKYGRHHVGCNAGEFMLGCTCGFTEALEGNMNIQNAIIEKLTT